MTFLGKNHIGFKYSEPSDITFKSFNPNLGEENETIFYEANEEETEEAVQLAMNAEIPFRNKTVYERASLLLEIKSELKKEKTAISIVYQAESGLTENRFEAEWKRTLFQLDHFASFLENEFCLETSEKSFLGGKNIKKKFLPIGPVVVFGASNFPLAYSTIGGDSVAALAAACPVIVKSHPMHAGTGNLVAECVVRAIKKLDFPEGIFSNLNAQSYELGTCLVQHEAIKAVAFTGSISGGVALLKLSEGRKRPIPVFAEMGSLNPIIFYPQKLKNNALEIAEEVAKAICSSSGQFCTKPGLLFVLESEETDLFLSELSNSMDKYEIEPMLHPRIAENFNTNREAILKLNGVSILHEKNGKRKWDAVHQLCEISATDFCNNPPCWDEVFGSFSLVVKAKSVEEIVACLSKLGGQLTCSFYADEGVFNEQNVLLNWAYSNVGRIIFNGVPTGVEVDATMHHGGVFPASSDSRFTAVGSDSIARFLRPVSIQTID